MGVINADDSPIIINAGKNSSALPIQHGANRISDLVKLLWWRYEFNGL